MQHLLPTENELSEQYHVSRCRTGQSRIPGEKIRKRNIYRRKENAAFPLRQIKEGMDDIATGNTRLFSEAMADIRSHRSR